MAMKRREPRSSARYFDTPGRPPFYKRYFRVVARLITVLSVVTAMAFPIGFGFTVIGREISRFPNVVALDPLTIGALEPLNQRSVVEDRYGNVIATLKSEQNRLPVSIDQVPKHLMRIFIDTRVSICVRRLELCLPTSSRAVSPKVDRRSLSSWSRFLFSRQRKKLIARFARLAWRCRLNVNLQNPKSWSGISMRCISGRVPMGCRQHPNGTSPNQ
jgi:hypothetical protein